MGNNVISNESIIAFLIRAAIPEVKDKSKLPEKGNLKTEDKLIWEAIYRAHRDVLTGRGNVTEYSSKKESPDSLNQICLALYDGVKCGEELSSSKLVSLLRKTFTDVPMGQIQKLVNMTLKYLLILSRFHLISLVIDESKCDCPLDSVILERLKEKTKWTRLEDEEEYNRLQEKAKRNSSDKVALEYDFINWQDLKVTVD